MAEFTPNFNLEKPDEDEFYNVAYFNENMDIIDEALKNAGQNEQLQSDVTEIKNDIGSAEDLSSNPTIFGKLAEIKETLTSKFSDVVSRITGIDSKIGTTTDTGGTSSAGSLMGKLNDIKDYLTNNLDNSLISDGDNTYSNVFYKTNRLVPTAKLQLNITESSSACADADYLYIACAYGVICRIKHSTLEIEYKIIDTKFKTNSTNTFIVDKTHLYLVDDKGILYKINKSTFSITATLNLLSLSDTTINQAFIGQTSSYLILRGKANSSYKPYRISKSSLSTSVLDNISMCKEQTNFQHVIFDNDYMYYFILENTSYNLYKTNISSKTESKIYTLDISTIRTGTPTILSITNNYIYICFDNIIYILNKSGTLYDKYYNGYGSISYSNASRYSNENIFELLASTNNIKVRIVNPLTKTYKDFISSRDGYTQILQLFISADELMFGKIPYAYYINTVPSNMNLIQFKTNIDGDYVELDCYKNIKG